jgi:predicted esterase
MLVSCAAAAAIAAQDPPRTPRAEPSPDVPGGKVLEWTSAENKPYWYRVPKRIDRSKPPNLLLMLHGTGLKWGWAFWNYPIAEGTFRGNDIVVAPEGMTDGGSGTFNFTQSKADSDHVAGIIAFFKKKLPVGKVYLYGHSQGAFFAYWFAGEHPELVDGIVAHAGNVLGNVKHPKAAKERVGIGILHGRADAVVPVDCAYATEKVYKDQGYKRVRMMIVEGLTEQSGHWPLPKEVAEMLAWLDQTSVDTARGAVEVALGEIRKDVPDVAVLVGAAAAAERLLKSAKADEKAKLAEQVAAVNALLAVIASRHHAAIDLRPDSRKTESPHGPWAAQFRAANRDLGAFAPWQASMRELRQRADAHDKVVAAAIARLDKTEGVSFAEAVKALETGFLATAYDDLHARLSKMTESPPKGVRKEELAKFSALAEARKLEVEQGLAAAAMVVSEAVGPFRARYAAWLQ